MTALALRVVLSAFGGIPRGWLVFALGLALAGVVGFAGVKGYRMGVSVSTARFEALRAEEKAEADRRQKALVSGVQKAAQEAYDAQVEAESNVARADRAVDGLREAAVRANLRADAAATAVADGIAARTLLAECAGLYRDVAREADRLRAVVIGLQAYAREVSQ